jgi:hypothetical protein
VTPEPIAPLDQHSPAEGEAPKATWFRRLTTVIFIIFCFEIGLFLLIYPWTDAWSSNYFAWIAPGSMRAPWHEFWNNSYVRGALSGIGVVNLWIAITEVFQMFSRRPE